MEPIDDGIHNCIKCRIYLEYGRFCTSQSEIHVPACQYCDLRFCCISPKIALLFCEEDTILDNIDEGEYVAAEGIIPYNIKTKYCKHMDMSTMNCKVYNQRPVACRIAGHNCLEIDKK